jgi:hypothetical protein
MSEETSIRVNFGRPVPIFPLNAVLLFPHGVLPLHIFEDRYRQMLDDALDGSGQIAMAVFEGSQWKQEYHGRPAVRPAVCLGQITKHYKLEDGRFNVAIQGVCRAKIVDELPPDGDRLYRMVMLEPIGQVRPDESSLDDSRAELIEMMSSGPLTDLRVVAVVVEHARNGDVPTSALLELITLSFIPETERRYELLAEGDPLLRAEMITDSLRDLARLIRRAAPQRRIDSDRPKGCHWN